MQITYTNKEALQNDPEVADKNKVTAEDMNEIKTVVNTNEEELSVYIADLENNQLTGQSSGTSIDLSDSADSRVRSIELEGNSEQDGEPTPENPQEIHSTGDSGSVNEKVQNKNLAESTTIQISTPIAHFNNYSGDITVAVKLTGGTSQFNCKLFFEDGTQQDFAIATRNSENKWYCNNRSVQKLSAISLYNVDNSNARTVEKVFIAEGTYQITSDDDYIDHQEQIYSIPCQQPMRAMGEYKDSFVKVDGNWYERHYIKSKILDGSETYSDFRTWGNYYRININIADAKTYSINNSNGQLSSHFHYNHEGVFAENTQSIPGIFAQFRGSTGFCFVIGQSSMEDFKTWLSNNNVELIYVLATPVNLPCTEEQIEALESLEKARTYKPVTHISSTDVVPATIDLTYVKDLETVINNLS